MTDVKRTQRDYLVALRGMVEGMDVVGEVPADEILEFIDKKIAQADAKSVKAKEKAAEKKNAVRANSTSWASALRTTRKCRWWTG